MTLYKRVDYPVLPRNIGAKLFLILLVFICTGFSSCDKASSVGLDVQPANDLLNVGYQDTTTLITKTVREDSLRTDQGLITSGDIYGAVLLGKYVDPIFGEASSSLYTQLHLETNNPGFGDNPICDSVVLSLSYRGFFYGEAAKTPPRIQTVNVYTLLDDMKSSVKYYSDTALKYSPQDLANNHFFVPEIAAKVSAENTLLDPQLRIPLQINFGQTLLNNQSTGNLSNGAAFQAFLKGFYITAKNTQGLNSGEGRILSYNIQNSKLTVYYHNSANSSLKYAFGLGTVSHFSNFEHNNYQNANPDLITQITDSYRNSYSINYIQSMAGVKTKIDFPYLTNWNSLGAISVDKAELVIKVLPPTIDFLQNTFNPPSTLYLFGINDDGTEYVIPDLYEETNSPGYYNGSYNSTSHEYRLSISRYVQMVMTGKLKNNGLHLLIPHISATINANRVVVGGGSYDNGNNPYQMKLNITYTKLH